MLYDNKINKIHPDAFDGLTKDLLRLNVARNSLSEVPSEALLQLKNLNQLDLSFNKIKVIAENTFAGMDKLDTLNLNYNKIKAIHDEAFYGLEEQLQSLSLQSNKISRFP